MEIRRSKLSSLASSTSARTRPADTGQRQTSIQIILSQIDQPREIARKEGVQCISRGCWVDVIEGNSLQDIAVRDNQFTLVRKPFELAVGKLLFADA